MERGQQWRHLMDLWTEADLQRSSLSLVPRGFGETVTAMEKCLRHTHTSLGSPLCCLALPAPGAASAPEPVPARRTAATATLEPLLLLMHVLNYTDYKLMDFNWLPMVAWGKNSRTRVDCAPERGDRGQRGFVTVLMFQPRSQPGWGVGHGVLGRADRHVCPAPTHCSDQFAQCWCGCSPSSARTSCAQGSALLCHLTGNLGCPHPPGAARAPPGRLGSEGWGCCFALPREG